MHHPIIALLALASTLCAQGAGTLSSNGLEPVLSIAGTQVGGLSQVVVDRLPAGGATTSWLAVSQAPGAHDLASIGIPGGVLGLSLQSQHGFTLLPLQGLSPTSAGMTFTAPGSLVGLPIYMQALHGSPGSWAVSDAEVVTYGHGSVRCLASRASSAGGVVLEQMEIDGALLAPLIQPLSGITLDEPELNNALGSLDFRVGVPRVDLSDGQRPRVVIPGQGSLYAYTVGAGQGGFFFVREGASVVDWHVGPGDEFEENVAAPVSHPYVAILEEDASSNIIHLLRTDGENWPGTSVRDLAVSTQVSVKGDSMTFVGGALVFSDENWLYRLSATAGASVQALILPPSGGQLPTEVGEELTVSDDGSMGAFVAGQSSSFNDVYSIDAAGVITNVTQLATDYGMSGYGNPEAGGVLALSPDGTRVAFTKTISNHRELFAQDTLGLTPVMQVTDNSFLATAYIEVESPISFLSTDRMLFAAGVTASSQDLFEANFCGGAVCLTNVTASSGQPLPPFGLGSTLTILDIMRLPSGGTLYRMTGGPNLQCLAGAPTATAPATVVFDGISEIVGSAAMGDRVVLALDGLPSRLVRLSPNQSPEVLLSLTSGREFNCVMANASGATALVAHSAPGGETMLLIQGGAAPVPLIGSSGQFGPTASYLSDGRAVFSHQVSGSTELLVLQPSGVVTVGRTLSSPVTLY